jgi:uncharacterized protein YecE (DUF72 family)
MRTAGRIRVGIGGWTYEPWRETFYPPGTPKTGELRYASRAVTAIEINGTFYRLQKPAVFAKWRDETPEDFVFTIKAPRYLVQRRNLADNAESLKKFLDSGLNELGSKLGPLLWQLAPTKQFDPDEIEAFFSMLPEALPNAQLRHAIEVRHPSFTTPAFLELAQNHNVSIVYTHADKYPGIADITGPFVYARLRQAVSEEPTGYKTQEIAQWRRRAAEWASGESPADLPLILGKPAQASGREVFVFFINGAKERAPAAAQHFLSLL